MARGQDLLFAHHGSSNEDNATKNLCWLFNNLPWSVSSELLKPLVEPFGQEAILDELDVNNIEVVAQEQAAVTSRRGGEKVLLGLAPSSHSYSDVDIDDFNPSNDNTTSNSRPDLTIQLGDKLVIAIEAKDGDFRRSQLKNHAQWLNAEQFETTTWKVIADQFNSVRQSQSDSNKESKTINDTSLPSASVELLLSEYERVLNDQLVTHSRVIASSRYSGGTNYVKASKDIDSDKLTGRVGDNPDQSLPVSVAISFRVSREDGQGGRVWFTREEWVSLLKSIKMPEYHRQLAQGDLSGIITDYDPTNDEDIVIAHIEDPDGNEKIMSYGTGGADRSDPLLFMNRYTAKGGNLRVIPTYDADEFDSLVADNDQMKRLFTNPESVFEEIEQSI